MKMNKKYYLKIEIRYRILEEDDYKYLTHIMQSDLFDEEKDCIDYGNKIINHNLWIERNTNLGNIDRRLERRYGYPLVVFRLKNRAEIFISVQELNIKEFEEINEELKKFDLSIITQAIS